jgi:hypothetical protein
VRNSLNSFRLGRSRHAGVPAFLFLFLFLFLGTLNGSVTWAGVEGGGRQIEAPNVSVTLNGLPSSPEALERYAGLSLHYLFDGRTLHVFLSPEQRDAFLQFRGRSRNAPASLKSTAGPTATFYEHKNRGGAVKQYSTSVFSLGSWSDVITSLETGTKSVVLWEHEGFRGASFTIPADVIVEDLGPFGWSDVASSIQFLP